jgi:N-acetylglutamate synthase-like GNAT family acetyltransferase
MGKVVIRNATNQDAKFILDLIFNIWTNEFNFKVNRRDTPDLHNIEEHYFKAGGIFLVATINNRIVGTIACSKLNTQQFALKRMFINKKYRRQGIAQQLIDTLFSKLLSLVKHHDLTIFLSTKNSSNSSAKYFYQKNNFFIIDKSSVPTNFPLFYQDDLFMMRHIGSRKNSENILS